VMFQIWLFSVVNLLNVLWYGFQIFL
jgi:hypothetical protein